MHSVVFIVGPTATGKTEIAFLLTKELNGEIVSCDSTLVYKEPQIITSKPPSYMLEEVKHNFVGIISVEDDYNVFSYYTSAKKKILELVNENKFVCVCGGSGLYFQAILDGIFEGVGKDPNLRKELQEKAELYGTEFLYKKLQEVDYLTAEKISKNDLKRIIRALEVYYLTGIPISQKKIEAKGLYGNIHLKIFGLSLERKILYERINQRVEKMFNLGAVEEVKKLLKLNLSITAEKIIGIREIKAYLEGKYNLEKAKEEMKKNTRHFAKRQITWFKKDSRIDWIDIADLSAQEIKNLILEKIR
ncbi:MAG: tRNA (adenosine(37)-N6)-dimethylallyltransferase MiaA [Candidatus Aenigmatarchaeota archaeon]